MTCGYWKDDGTEDGYCEHQGVSCNPDFCPDDENLGGRMTGTPHDRTRRRLERQVFGLGDLPAVDGLENCTCPNCYTTEPLIECRGLLNGSKGWSLCWNCGEHIDYKGRIM